MDILLPIGAFLGALLVLALAARFRGVTMIDVTFGALPALFRNPVSYWGPAGLIVVFLIAFADKRNWELSAFSGADAAIAIILIMIAAACVGAGLRASKAR